MPLADLVIAGVLQRQAVDDVPVTESLPEEHNEVPSPGVIGVAKQLIPTTSLDVAELDKLSCVMGRRPGLSTEVGRPPGGSHPLLETVSRVTNSTIGDTAGPGMLGHLQALRSMKHPDVEGVSLVDKSSPKALVSNLVIESASGADMTPKHKEELVKLLGDQTVDVRSKSKVRQSDGSILHCVSATTGSVAKEKINICDRKANVNLDLDGKRWNSSHRQTTFGSEGRSSNMSNGSGRQGIVRRHEAQLNSAQGANLARLQSQEMVNAGCFSTDAPWRPGTMGKIDFERLDKSNASAVVELVGDKASGTEHAKLTNTVEFSTDQTTRMPFGGTVETEVTIGVKMVVKSPEGNEIATGNLMAHKDLQDGMQSVLKNSMRQATNRYMYMSDANSENSMEGLGLVMLDVMADPNPAATITFTGTPKATISDDPKAAVPGPDATPEAAVLMPDAASKATLSIAAGENNIKVEA